MHQFDLDWRRTRWPASTRASSSAAAKGDNGSRLLVEKILHDEEEHIDWLEAQLTPDPGPWASRTTSPSRSKSRASAGSATRARASGKRVEILRSAAAAFRRRGYHGASVDQIARALHMTKGNLYYYFESKEEILYFCHDYSLDILLDLLRRTERGGGPPERRHAADADRGVRAHDHRQAARHRPHHGPAGARARAGCGAVIAKRDRFDRGIPAEWWRGDGRGRLRGR